MTRRRRKTISIGLIAALALVASLPAASAEAKKRKFRGLVLSSVTRSPSGSVRLPITMRVNLRLANPSRRRARPQPLTVTLEGGSGATTSTVTPGIRRRSSTSLPVALNLPVDTPTGNYTLTACLGGKVFPGTGRCRSPRSKVRVLSPRGNITINPSSKAFGDVAVGTDSAQQAFTITNLSLAQSTTPAASVTGVGYQIASNGCTAPISPGGACSVAVLFHPTAAGSSNGSVRVTASGDTETAVADRHRPLAGS